MGLGQLNIHDPKQNAETQNLYRIIRSQQDQIDKIASERFYGTVSGSYTAANPAAAKTVYMQDGLRQLDPDCIIINSTANATRSNVIRTRGNASNQSRLMIDGTVVTDGITAMGPGYFTIGTNANLCTADEVYNWVAIGKWR